MKELKLSNKRQNFTKKVIGEYKFKFARFKNESAREEAEITSVVENYSAFKASKALWKHQIVDHKRLLTINQIMFLWEYAEYHDVYQIAFVYSCLSGWSKNSMEEMTHGTLGIAPFGDTFYLKDHKDDDECDLTKLVHASGRKNNDKSPVFKLGNEAIDEDYDSLDEWGYEILSRHVDWQIARCSYFFNALLDGRSLKDVIAAMGHTTYELLDS